MREETAAGSTGFAPKIATVLCQELGPLQRLEVAALIRGAVAAGGGRYVDASGNAYLPKFNGPVLVFGRKAAELRQTADGVKSSGGPCSVFTDALFSACDDADNRAAVASVEETSLAPVGPSFRRERETADRTLKGSEAAEVT